METDADVPRRTAPTSIKARASAAVRIPPAALILILPAQRRLNVEICSTPTAPKNPVPDFIKLAPDPMIASTVSGQCSEETSGVSMMT